jgi:hypothetical protein
MGSILGGLHGGLLGHRRRLWIFRITALVLGPVGCLLVTEAGTRMVGYGTPSGFSIRRQLGDETRALSNPPFAKKYFGPELCRACVPFNLPIEKPRSVYRIFVLGGSAARGFPQPAFGLSRLLEKMLNHSGLADDGPRVEVINTAITAINSHVVRDIARDCSRLEPDLFVVYLGNNEVVGPFGPGTVFRPLAGNRNAIHASLAVRSTRSGQLASDILRRAARTCGGRTEQWGSMEMFLNHQVPVDDPRLEVMYRHFEANLSDICRAGQRAGAPVVLCTVGVNEKDCAPFASHHRLDVPSAELAEWTRHFEEGRELQETGHWALAAESFRLASKIDAKFAELNYRLGECYWQLEKYPAARLCLALARENDSLRFRADDRINEIARSVAENHGDDIRLVDADHTLRSHSAHGIRMSRGLGLFTARRIRSPGDYSDGGRTSAIHR